MAQDAWNSIDFNDFTWFPPARSSRTGWACFPIGVPRCSPLFRTGWACFQHYRRGRSRRQKNARRPLTQNPTHPSTKIPGGPGRPTPPPRAGVRLPKMISLENRTRGTRVFGVAERSPGGTRRGTEIGPPGGLHHSEGFPAPFTFGTFFERAARIFSRKKPRPRIHRGGPAKHRIHEFPYFSISQKVEIVKSENGGKVK